MTIVTQTDELVNYDFVKKITLVSGTVEDEATGDSLTVYVMLAFDVLSEVSEDEYEKCSIQLGAFNSENECRNAFEQLIGSISAKDNVFVVPQPEAA